VDSPLRAPGFIGLLVYRLLAMLSYQIVAVTVGWHVYEITRDAWSLGLIGLAEVIPYFCFALFDHPAAGHARCDARTSVLDQWHLHRLVQRTGRVRIRARGAFAGTGAIGRLWRLHDACRGRHHCLEGTQARRLDLRDLH
jgi:hypothetical protein